MGHVLTSALNRMTVSKNVSKANKMKPSKMVPRQTTLPFRVVDKATPVPTKKKKKTGRAQGRPTKFTTDEYKWIQGTFPAFDEKVLNSTGTADEKLELKSWKDKKWKAFKEAFEESLEREGNWRGVRR